MKSQIYMDEGKSNTAHKFGETAGKYYPARVYREDGKQQVALFTEDQIQKAVERANRNAEDIPDDPYITIWERMFF